MVRRRLTAWAALLMLTTMTGPAPSAQAGATPTNGKIAFTMWQNGFVGMFTVNPDGSEFTQLAWKRDASGSPSWSPDGSRFTYFWRSPSGAMEIFAMNADGTGKRGGISVVNSDGSGLQAIPGTRNDRYPDWSPDGTMFLFTHVSHGNWSHSTIGVTNVDGGDHLRLTSQAGSFDAFDPAWQAL